MAALGLPSELGTIEERFQGKQDRVVLLIQDAHSAGEAQKSMRQILEFYEKQGVRLIAVEGAAGKMDTELFRAYPDREKLKEAFDFYLGKGELSGAAVNAVLSPFESDYYGIEDKKLYKEGVALFLEALAQQPEQLAGLSSAKAELQTLKDKNYSPKLLELDSKLNLLENNKMDLPAFLEYLTSVILRAKPEESPNRSFAQRSSPLGSLRMTHSRFPHLADYFSETTPAVLDFGPEIEKAVNVILRAQPEGSPSKILSAKGGPAGILAGAPSAQDDKKSFQEKLQAYKTEQILPQAFAHDLSQAAGKAGVALNFSKELHEAASRYGRLNRMKGSEFFEELEDFILEIKQELFRNDTERKTDADDRRLRLTERLINLKLTRKEWEEIKNAGAAPGGEKGTGNTPRPVPFSTFEEHFAFYENAEARENVFHQNLLRLMDRHKTQAAAFVAGGFHSSGMAGYLKAAGISYVLISPAIKELPEEGLYSQHMRGEVSWK
ncbi:MAG TPA: hypothetical protein VJC08_01240, partial [bacterium]|nr:hypothetical protein [bacterium]